MAETPLGAARPASEGSGDAELNPGRKRGSGVSEIKAAGNDGGDGFKLCGSGEYPKTFLTGAMKPWGEEIE